MHKEAIEIEKMLFGDYRVQVWDKDLDSRLDREYFCRGWVSALYTAKDLQSTMFKGLPIQFRDGDVVTLVETNI